MKDENKSEVEAALEDLFDEPFITRSEEQSKKIEEPSNSDKLYSDGENIVKIASYSDDEIKPAAPEYLSESFYDGYNSSNEEEKNEETPVEVEDTTYNYNDVSFENPYIVDTAVKTSKYGLYAILSLVLIFIIVTTFIIVKTNQERIVECTFKAADTGYKITDSYIIAHKNGNLTYVQGEYNYEALNDEYVEQLEYIKEEKLPVIINSNGMPGFTHVLETTGDYVKVYSYYDITKMNFDVIDKNNERTTPLSYVGLKSTTTFKKLEKKLKKQGYVCKKHN